MLCTTETQPACVSAYDRLMSRIWHCRILLILKTAFGLSLRPIPKGPLPAGNISAPSVALKRWIFQKAKEIRRTEKIYRRTQISLSVCVPTQNRKIFRRGTGQSSEIFTFEVVHCNVLVPRVLRRQPQGNLRIVGISYDFGTLNACHVYELTR